MSWRDKVQAMRDGVNSQKCPNPSLPKPPKPSFVSFGSTPPTPFQEKTGVSGHPARMDDFPENLQKPAMSVAANDLAQGAGLVPEQPDLDPDRWCWPHSDAMTGREIDTFTGRASQFNRRGMPSVAAEELAYQLVARDREDDDRRLCLECLHLSGQRGAWRCNQWQRAGMGAAGVPAGLVLVLQRCDGFRNASR